MKQGFGGATFPSYVLGYISSVLLTLTAFFLVFEKVYSSHIAVPILLSLGGVQALAQLQFFFHLGRESRPRWNFLVFGFMSLIVTVLIGGTLWIMITLNERVMPI
jgi:cytochrome o ubiquinol oxidase subunit IV